MSWVTDEKRDRRFFPRFMEKLDRDFISIRNVILNYHDALAKEAEKTKERYKNDQSVRAFRRRMGLTE